MPGREEQVERALKEKGIDVANLQVRDGGQDVALYGSVRTEQVKAQAKEVAKYVTLAPIENNLTVGEAAGAAGGAQRYTVKSGDTLTAIAQRFYGDGSKWRRIHEANRAQIPNPDLIRPGQELTIPSA